MFAAQQQCEERTFVTLHLSTSEQKNHRRRNLTEESSYGGGHGYVGRIATVEMVNWSSTTSGITIIPASLQRLPTRRHRRDEQDGTVPFRSYSIHLLLSIINFISLIETLRICWLHMQSRTTWHDVIGKHCPIFAVNREVLWLCIWLIRFLRFMIFFWISMPILQVLIPIAKPVGYTGTDPYKMWEFIRIRWWCFWIEIE